MMIELKEEKGKQVLGWFPMEILFKYCRGLMELNSEVHFCGNVSFGEKVWIFKKILFTNRWRPVIITKYSVERTLKDKTNEESQKSTWQDTYYNV